MKDEALPDPILYLDDTKFNKSFIYHPKLLNLFTLEELSLIMKDSAYSINEENQVSVIVVLSTKIDVEIYTDCEAKNSETALISLLDNRGYDYPNEISKEIFLKAFYESESIELACLSVNE